MTQVLVGEMARGDGTPDEPGAAGAGAEAVRVALERFPETARRIVLMRHRDRRGFDEIAAALGMGADDVRQTWFCALEALAEVLRGPA